MPVWHFSWNKIEKEKVVYGFLSFSGVFLPWKMLNSMKLNQSKKNININNLYPCA